eukprot:SM000054S18148  [mRNA]  locus=s54:697755:699233:- [translate_table: standard]
MQVVDVNRTCKVTKGGGLLSYTALVVCGNEKGVVGFGKGKSAEVSDAVDKVRRCASSSLASPMVAQCHLLSLCARSIGAWQASPPLWPLAAAAQAYARAVKNLHYFESYNGHTIFHEQVAKYEKTKVYLWPAKSGQGITAANTVAGILRLGGFKDVKSKIVGSRHPHNTVKATFLALSLVGVQETSVGMHVEPLGALVFDGIQSPQEKAEEQQQLARAR